MLATSSPGSLARLERGGMVVASVRNFGALSGGICTHSRLGSLMKLIRSWISTCNLIVSTSLTG